MNPFFALLLIIHCFSSTSFQDDALAAELQKLQGTWHRIAAEIDGQKIDDTNRPPDKIIKLVIKDNQFHNNTFTLDITAAPKHINIATLDQKRQPANLPGIYELKGDILKVCLPFPFEGKFDHIPKRPTEFGSRKGSNMVTEVYRRVK